MRWPVLFLLAIAQLAHGRCDLIIEASDLVAQQINGETVYTLSAQHYQALSQPCINVADMLQRNQDNLAAYRRQVVEQQQLIDDYQQQIEHYRQVVAEASQINQRYQSLSDDYQLQLQQQAGLIRRYQQSADELDSLAGDYRQLAARSLQRYRVGLAVGAGNHGLAGALQAGIGPWSLMLHRMGDHNSALVGAELQF